jgi:competence protein ComGC
MASSASDTALIAHLQRCLSLINFYFGMFIFVFGIVGNLLNIIVLSQRSLRSNPCVTIFIASSAAGIVAILSGLTSRVLSGVAVDLSATVSWICKMRGFILFASRSATFWLIMLATFDRWLLSSMNVHRRHLSSMKNSLRGITLVIVVSIGCHCQLFYCYEANLVGTPLKCFMRNVECRLLNDLTFAIVAILLPLLLITVFGLMTISNMHETRGSVQPLGVAVAIQSGQTTDIYARQQRRSKKTDQRLFGMLFVQVILLAFFTLPLAVQKLYATLTITIDKSPLRITVEDFIYQVALISTYFATGMPFYVNTLAGGSVFRKGIRTLKDSVVRKCFRR